MNRKTLLFLIALLSVCLPLAAFGQQGAASEPVATDYATPDHWLHLPVVVDKKVDVFYLYPTVWQKSNETEARVCAIDNPSMLKGAKAAFGRQATAFETVGNMFAPFYRQLDLSPVDREKLVAGLPTLDAVAAFDYYIKHYNNNRPFILAGHSQGANVLINLLATYMKAHPEVQARMVAAYAIGNSVTGEYLAANPHLKFAEGPDDTGVIVSWNTEAPDVVPGTNPVVIPGGIAINPITWTRDETPAPAELNLGSIMPEGEFFVPVAHYADARVDKKKGVVICSTVDEDKLNVYHVAFLRGIYHSYDYLFYYYNLRQNAANRVEKFLAQHALK